MKELYQKFLKSSGVCTDTRKITPDCIFFALKGDNFNGNNFALQALEAGAKYVVVDEVISPSDNRLIKVENVLTTLQQLANHHRKQFNIPFIGITGSNGKTSTKELIAAVLAKKYVVLATLGNFNNHIGVPLTLLALKPKHEIAIIEMGANKFKDIEELCTIAKPTHGIITNIGKAHLEGFHNYEGVLKTKLELYNAVAAVNGMLFQNEDDDVLINNTPNKCHKLTYGISKRANIVGELQELNPFVKFKWSELDFTSSTVQTHLLGEYNFYNFLAAIAIGSHFGVSAAEIQSALETYIPTNNRSQVEQTAHNTLIVDCYNANPSSMTSALSSFIKIDHSNKLAILGDMRELGKEEIMEHQAVLNYVTENKIDCIFVGSVFCSLTSGEIKAYPTVDDLIASKTLASIKNKMILLKGSRGIQLEKVISIL